MTTANKALNEPAYNSSGWDVPLNNNFGYIDSSLGSTATISSTSAVTLTSSQYQCMRLLFTGSLSADLSVSVPSGVGGFWIVTNSTTDASAAIPTYLTIKSTAGGSIGVVVPRSVNTIVFSNGSEVYFAQQNTTPSGSIIQFAGSIAPSGYLICDGSAINRTTYPNLFAAIGTAWGPGNGTTTFNVPDLRGIFLRGTGVNGTYSNAIGASVGTSTAGVVGSHTHSDSGHAHAVSPNNSYFYYQPSGNYRPAGAGDISLSSTITIQTGYANIQPNQPAGTENTPTNAAVLYCIKF